MRYHHTSQRLVVVVATVGSIQCGGGHLDIRGCCPHIRSSVFPQPRRDGRLRCSQSVRDGASRRTFPGRGIPHRLPRSVGCTGHVSAAGDSARNQLWSGDGVVS